MENGAPKALQLREKHHLPWETARPTEPPATRARGPGNITPATQPLSQPLHRPKGRFPAAPTPQPPYDIIAPPSRGGSNLHGDAGGVGVPAALWRGVEAGPPPGRSTRQREEGGVGVTAAAREAPPAYQVGEGGLQSRQCVQQGEGEPPVAGGSGTQHSKHPPPGLASQRGATAGGQAARRSSRNKKAPTDWWKTEERLAKSKTGQLLEPKVLEGVLETGGTEEVGEGVMGGGAGEELLDGGTEVGGSPVPRGEDAARGVGMEGGGTPGEVGDTQRSRDAGEEEAAAQTVGRGESGVMCKGKEGMGMPMLSPETIRRSEIISMLTVSLLRPSICIRTVIDCSREVHQKLTLAHGNNVCGLHLLERSRYMDGHS